MFLSSSRYNLRVEDSKDVPELASPRRGVRTRNLSVSSTVAKAIGIDVEPYTTAPGTRSLWRAAHARRPHESSGGGLTSSARDFRRKSLDVLGTLAIASDVANRTLIASTPLGHYGIREGIRNEPMVIFRRACAALLRAAVKV